MMSSISASMTTLNTWLWTYSPPLLGAILIMLVGLRISSYMPKYIPLMLARAGIEKTLARFAGSIVRYGVLLIAIIAALEMVGFNTTSLAAILGASTLAIGLALKDTLSHFASGIMLMSFRPFKIGDYIEVAGHSGTVDSITLFTTEVTTLENARIIVPNGEVWGKSIINHTANPYKQVVLNIGVDYNTDLKKAAEVAAATVAKDARSILDEPPFVKVTELKDSSVNLQIRVQCKTSDYWALKRDLTYALKESFDEESISIPFPHIKLVQG